MIAASVLTVPSLNVATAKPLSIANADCSAPISADAAPASVPCGANASAATFGVTRPTVTKNDNCSATTIHSGTGHSDVTANSAAPSSERHPHVACEHVARPDRAQRDHVEPARRHECEAVQADQQAELLRRQDRSVASARSARRSRKLNSAPMPKPPTSE